MGGFFGVVSKEDCLFDLFFGTDYHSHLGTRRGGLAVYGENGFCLLYTSEKQFRFPLGYANQRPKASTWTVTGSRCV